MPYPLLWMLYSVSTPEIMATVSVSSFIRQGLHMHCLTDGLPTCY